MQMYFQDIIQYNKRLPEELAEFLFSTLTEIDEMWTPLNVFKSGVLFILLPPRTLLFFHLILDIRCGDVCFLCDIMELDGTLLQCSGHRKYL